MAKILDQPRDVSVGDTLVQLLSNNSQHGFETFYFVVAYVKRSGVAHLKSAIEAFRNRGGKVKAVVGIDQRNTSAQGLQDLLPLCDSLYVYHNESLASTFHPKVYAFEVQGKTAVILVGSSNLTEGGLYTNYETSFHSEYDLTQKDQSERFMEFKRMFDSYSTPSSVCRKLDGTLISNLRDRNYVSDEDQKPTRQVKRRGAASMGALFGTELIRAPTVSRIKKKPITPGIPATQQPGLPANEILVRYIPRAGGRTSQVHFTREIVEGFFGFILGKTSTIQLQEAHTGRPLGVVEKRQLVYSRFNKNPKIEINGARALGNYPPNSPRPIIIVEEQKPGFFKYMILQSGDSGYGELAAELARQPKKGAALSYWLTNLRTLVKTWGDYARNSNPQRN